MAEQFFHCTGCGAAISEDNNGAFCKFCGAKLPQDISDTHITNNVTNNEYHTHVYNTEPAQTIISYQLPKEQRVIKNNPDKLAGIILGAFIFIWGFSAPNLFGVALGIGLIFYGVTRKKLTNYCVSCYAPKDFKVKTCRRCGKKQ